MEINGKELQQVITELAAPFKKNEIKTTPDGKAYVDFSVMLDRMDTVVGVFNYSVEYPTTEIVEVGTETEVMVSALLTIYDDEGRCVCKKQALGGAKVIFPKLKEPNGKDIFKDGKPVLSTIPASFDNVCDSASHDALKRAFKMLGMGKDLRAINKAGKSKGSNHGNQQAAEVTESYALEFIEPVREMSKKGAYSVKAADQNGVFVKVIFWSDAVEALEAEKTNTGKSLWQVFCEKCNAGRTSAAVVGTRSSFRGEDQIVFASFKK